MISVSVELISLSFSSSLLVRKLKGIIVGYYRLVLIWALSMKEFLTSRYGIERLKTRRRYSTAATGDNSDLTQSSFGFAASDDDDFIRSKFGRKLELGSQ